MTAGEPVILVHGYKAGGADFDRMAVRLSAAGFRPVVVEYDSSGGDWDRLARVVTGRLERLEGDGPVSFVGHSLGNLLIRKALDAGGAWRDRLRPRRMVMLAPPNRGSRLFRTFAGVWRTLTRTPDALPGVDGDPSTTVPPAAIPFAIVAGGAGNRFGYNPFLGADNDGLLRLDETEDPAAALFTRVRATHWTLPRNPAAIDATLDFLGAP